MAKVIDFLSKASNLKTLIESPAYAVLRTHYMTKCWDVQSNTNIVLDESEFGQHTLCQKCGNLWNNKNNTHRIIKTQKRKKLLKKDLKPTNVLIKICQHCKNKVKVKLVRRRVKSIQPKSIEEPKPEVIAVKPKKKKQKAKNKFAGLNVNAVIAGQKELKSTKISTEKVPQNDTLSIDRSTERKKLKKALCKSQHLMELFR